MANEAEEWIEAHQELLATVFLWRYNLRGEPLKIPFGFIVYNNRRTIGKLKPFGTSPSTAFPTINRRYFKRLTAQIVSP